MQPQNPGLDFATGFAEPVEHCDDRTGRLAALRLGTILVKISEYVNILSVALCSVLLCGPALTSRAEDSPIQTRPTLSLAGTWQFRLGGPPAPNGGPRPVLTFTDTIQLPGTTDTHAKGPENPERWTGGLTRLHKYIGPAWYERGVTIPSSWRNRRVTLFLERAKFSEVWLDGRSMGSSPILCTPQEYPLGNIEPGAHRITLVVDNSRRPVNAEMHQMSDNTQGNWNGVIGRIELIATPAVWVDNMQVYPDIGRRIARVKVKLANATGQPGAGRLEALIRLEGGERRAAGTDVSWTAEGGLAELVIPLGPAIRLWDEFEPVMHTLTVRLATAQGLDVRSTRFGMRGFAAKGTQFAINGRLAFLRGKHDACVFPLTGHPPMETGGWLQYFRVLKELNVNHVRFHTWTPPEAAFAAADELGIYLQPELPFWGTYTEAERRALMPEAERILKTYGNHPSFVMLSLGNECDGSRAIMAAMVRTLRALDARRLYAQGSNNNLGTRPLTAGDDYWTTVRVSTSERPVLANVRGSFATVDGGNGHVQVGPADTLHDYAAAIAGIPVPVVGHEVGQYTVYPDFREIPRYTGVFRARNLEHFRARLADAGMLAQAPEFLRATCRLAQICYREDVEAALRTPGFGGFQLLDLQDFPGQGTALVGLLNAFLDRKPGFEAGPWREACAPVVPLARFDRYAWTTAETLSARVQVANYGPRDLPGGLEWTLQDSSGQVLRKGRLGGGPIRQGSVPTLGTIEIPLAGLPAPARSVLELRLPADRPGDVFANHYNIWIYPPRVDLTTPPGVTLTRAFDAETRRLLAAGGRVVLIPSAGGLVETTGGGFATDFWCWPMFHNRPGTMGLLCDPRHPALAGFPTDSHSDWQWFPIVSRSQPVILDGSPRGFRPVVQVIDNLERAHRLGLVFEARVGPGRLLVCATDLPRRQDRPEARQLLHSLLAYAASDQFRPEQELDASFLARALATRLPVARATASTTQTGHGAELAVDGDPVTRWCAESNAAPQWLRLDLGEVRTILNCRIVWESDRPGYACVIEGSEDGTTWKRLSGQRGAQGEGMPEPGIAVSRARHVRINVLGLPRGQWASVREVVLVGEE